MKRSVTQLVILFVLICGNQKLHAQTLEVVVKKVHPKLTWVAAEDMRVPGHSFKQKGYNKGNFDAQFTSCMLWVKPIIKAPFSPKVAGKFKEDFQAGSFTPFLWHFATDTRAKQKQKSDPKKYKNLEMGDPELDSIMGFPAVVLPYRFMRDDNRLLKTVEKTSFIGRRAIVFMDGYLLECVWEYVPDEHDWNHVCQAQLQLLEVK